MTRRDRYGYSVSDAEFAAWKNGKKGARPSASGGVAGGSGCLMTMAAALVMPVILIIGRKRHV